MRAALIVIALSASPALAAEPPRKPADPPTEVSAVTVYTSTAPPKLVSTYPAANQAVAPGVFVMKLTFDQQMVKTGFDFSAEAGGDTPDCLKTPRLLNDGKTFVLLCRARSAKTYALAFNASTAGGFVNRASDRASAASLAFSTNAEEPVRSLADALKAAGLRDIDSPIEEAPEPPSLK